MATFTISEALSKLEGFGERVANEAAQVMKDEIVRNAKEGTGKLAASVNVKRLDESSWSVGTDLYYAKYVNDGRGPVVPKKAKALRWYSPRLSGNAVFSQYAGPAEGIDFTGKTKAILENMKFNL